MSNDAQIWKNDSSLYPELQKTGFEQIQRKT